MIACFDTNACFQGHVSCCCWQFVALQLHFLHTGVWFKVRFIVSADGLPRVIATFVLTSVRFKLHVLRSDCQFPARCD